MVKLRFKDNTGVCEKRCVGLCLCVSLCVVVCLGKGDPCMDKRWNGNLRSVSTNLSLLGLCIADWKRKPHWGCVCIYSWGQTFHNLKFQTKYPSCSTSETVFGGRQKQRDVFWCWSLHDFFFVADFQQHIFWNTVKEAYVKSGCSVQ